VDPLIGALKDEDKDVRETAVQALGQFKDPRAAGPLVDALRDWPSMSSVGRSLKKIGKPAVEPLVAALADDNPAVRAAAAETLGSIGDRRAVEPLVLALKDEDPQARKNAVTALSWIQDPRAVEPLIAVLNDEDEGVQSEAAWALSKIAGKDFGKNFLEWQEWWDKNKETFLEAK
jgi:HEAT repeat protein